MSEMRFVEDFTPPTYDEWVAEVERALKGAPFDKKMFTKTYEGLTLRPIYTRQDWPPEGDPSGFPGAMPFTRGSHAAGNRVGNWDVRQLYTDPDPKDANDVLLRELERGTNSLILRLDRAARAGKDGDAAGDDAGRDGIMIYSVDDLDLLLTGVQLDLAPIILQPGAQFLPAAGVLMALWERRGTAADKALGCFGADPVGTLAGTGSLPVPLDQALAQLGDLAKYTAGTYAQVTAVSVDTSPYHNAGATETMDLAAAMATAVAYLRAMTDAGMDIDAACRQINFTLPVDCDQFLGICKLRAARKLWSRVAEACGASEPARAMRLHATTAERILTQRDPWVNILRTTVSCFAGAIGGADAVTVLPLSAALGLPDRLGRRIARNTHHILAEESNLAMVIDTGGGSWYIESRTDDLARTAWGDFQEIEKAGGMAAVLKDGSFAQRIAESWAGREKNLAKRKDGLTGVSEFPNIHEPEAEVKVVDMDAARAAAADRLATARKKAASAPAEATAAAVKDAAAAGATIGAMADVLKGVAITPLPRHRLAEAFEALRDAADAEKEKTGERPKIFLANLGPIAKHTTRATFARNLFEVGGIETLTNQGFKDAESCAQAFKESGARVAILCSADPIYAEMAEDAARALKGAGCEYLFLAGAPGDKKDAYGQAGIDDYIFMGCDVLSTLQTTLKRLGVIAS